jgi:peroxiredoxin
MKIVNRFAGVLAALALAGFVSTATAGEGHDHAHAKAKVGETAPDFKLKSADGKEISLDDYKDKVVVLEWCSYDCPFSHKDGKAALPKTRELAKAYADKGVVWFGVDSTHNHNADGVTAFYKDHEAGYPILLDTDGTVGRKYGATNTPHIFIINKGKLVYAGALDEKDGGSRNYTAEALDAILAGKDVPVAETKPYGCSVKYAKKGSH